MYDNYGRGPPVVDEPPPPPQKVLRFDKKYALTMPGALKLVQLLCNFIGFICIKVAWNVWISSIFYNLLYWIAIVVTSLFLLMYSIHFVEKYDNWPWLKVEFVYCAAVCATYIVLSIIATTLGENTGYAVSFFGLIAFLAYGYEGYKKYKAWKKGLPPQ